MRYEKDEKRIAAFKKLVELGILIPVDENLELYHGRAGKQGEEWKVEPNHNNGGVQGDHRNFYNIPVLSTTTDKDAAKKYAELRAEDGGLPEVYKIVPYSQGSYIINAAYTYDQLTNDQHRKIMDSLRELSVFLVSESELAPVKFEYRDKYQIVYDKLKQKHIESNYYFISNDACLEVFEDLRRENIPMELINHVAGAMNAKLMLIYYPNEAMNKYVNGSSEYGREMFGFKDHEGKKQTGPLLSEYIASWLYHNNIIGVKDLITAIAIDKQFDGIYIFDTSKINTEKAVGEKVQAIMGEFGEITRLLENFTGNEEMKEFFQKATPEEVIKFGKQNSKYKKMLEGDAGNWEKYTVEEHTEAVLRNFDDAYADEVPEELYPFMKFVILVHDLGKAKGKTWGGGGQKHQNEIACGDFCDDLGIDPKITKLMQFIIGDSQMYTTQYYVMKNVSAHDELVNACRKQLEELSGSKPSENLVNGLASICKILQTCDSGAYTAYGVVRDSKTGVYYRGGNYKWTMGFKEPKDPRKKSDLRFKEPEERQ